MRKAQKEQLLEILQTLSEAHKTIRQYIKRCEPETVRALLSECQQGAIQVGTIIEQNEGEDCPTVARIEDYCEELYQVSLGIWNRNAVQKTYKRLNKALYQVKSSAVQDIPSRLEVVFLPYKASMFDSLESVWRAADADPDCDAYVIPIPYYDKNPDGSFRETHYEGGQYPKDVPVVHYASYDFEKRRPDIIFIHNPYDESNYVTSVEPFFYAKNLKQYTEQLVYIPYFVLEKISPDDQTAIESMEHFCTLPGVIYADRVIVQSEDMRRIYIDVLSKHMGERARVNWEETIAGLGSPKYDKAATAKKENVTVPEEWLNIIRKTGGNWKRIVLYNTGVASMLRHNEKMLKKICDALQVFKENQEDVALLWRPHPLIQAAIKSMRPQLWQEYQAIVEQYRAEGWGIYDDTSDLNRAVAISDAYFGDYSSVVQLCENSGKPIMIQNIKVIDSPHLLTRHISLWAARFCVDGNSVWFVHGKINVLMKYDMSTGKIDIIGKIPGEKSMAASTYASIVKNGRRLFLVPSINKNICVYDTITHQFSICKIRGIDTDIRSPLFINSYTYGKYLYCIPCDYHQAVRVDMESLETAYLTSFKEKGSTRYVSDSLRWNENLIAGTWAGSGEWFLYDMAKDKLTTKKLPLDDAKITSMASDGEFLYINDYNKQRLLKYAISQDAVRDIIKTPFPRVRLKCFLNGNIMVDPVYEDSLFIMDRDGRILYHAENEGSDKNILNYEYCDSMVYERYLNKQYLFDRNKSVLYEILEDGRIQEYAFTMTRTQIRELVKLAGENLERPIVEDELFTLDYLLKICAAAQEEAETKQPDGLSVGEAIWTAVASSQESSKEG